MSNLSIAASAALLAAFPLTAQSTAQWQAQVLSKPAPKQIGGRIEKVNDVLRWLGPQATTTYSGHVAYISDLVFLDNTQCLIFGLTSAKQGVVAVAQMANQFRETAYSLLPAGTLVFGGEYDPINKDVYVIDPAKQVLWAGQITTAPLPTVWEKIGGKSLIPIIASPDIGLDRGTQGGVNMIPARIGASAMYHIQRSGSGWHVENPRKLNLAPKVSIDGPCEIEGPLVVNSTRKGRGVLEKKGQGAILDLGMLAAGKNICNLPRGTKLRLTAEYRVRVSDAGMSIDTAWFKARDEIGTPDASGVISAINADVPGGFARVRGQMGSVKVDISSNAETGKMKAYAWYSITKDGARPPMVDLGRLDMMLPSSITRIDLPLRHRSNSAVPYSIAIPLPMPSAALAEGRTLWCQVAVVGPNSGDAALSQVIGVSISAEEPGAWDPRLAASLQKFWRSNTSDCPSEMLALLLRLWLVLHR